MPSSTDNLRVSLGELALSKLTRVLGEARGRRVYDETLADVGLAAIETADDLYRFGDALSKRKGFESAVGAMLGVAAVAPGAAGRAR
ncbi:MAG: hypothetical protein R3A52_23255 [Polyangiales bacterium]